MESGVYQIVNTANGKRYIGSSNNIDTRLAEHHNRIVRNSHDNRHLQNAWNKYGESAFLFLAVDYCENYLEKEQEYFDLFLSLRLWDRLYNINKVAGPLKCGPYNPNFKGGRYVEEGWLREKYVKEGYTLDDIAALCNVHPITISRWMDKFEIERRGSSEHWRGVTGLYHFKTIEGPFTDRSWLRRQYVEKGKSVTQIAKECAVSATPIRGWLGRHNIPLRVGGYPEQALHRDENWLREKYLKEKMSTPQMAKLAGCSSGSINVWLKHYSIPLRTLSEAKTDSTLHRNREWLHDHYVNRELSSKEIAEIAGVTKGTICKWLRKFGIDSRGSKWLLKSNEGMYEDKDWLYDQYHKKRLTTPEMAEMAGCSSETVRNWMRKYNIPLRDPSERNRDITGNNNPAFKGGPHTNPDWLQERYWQDGLSLSKIGDIAGCSAQTVSNWMDKFGIKKRTAR